VSAVLWHIPVSHYNEKVRWALDYKEVEHERRAPPAGVHMVAALAITRGRSVTFPLLELDGTVISDSTAIIAALEERNPEPPLYPSAEAERARALELEEFFDEELGPHIRLLAWHEITRDRECAEAVSLKMVPPPLRRFPGAARRGGSLFLNARYHVGDADRAAIARDKVLGALDRLEAELGDGGYLAGGAFSVADLTAAALFYPLVGPPEGPQVVTEPPPAWHALRDELADRRGYQWVEEMFHRHRKRGASAPAAAATS
jgi:glutathione S-transferase